MEIKTKKVVESVTFSEDEVQFMKNLADVVEEECGNHFSCETCPFARDACNDCDGFREILRFFADVKRLEF